MLSFFVMCRFGTAGHTAELLLHGDETVLKSKRAHRLLGQQGEQAIYLKIANNVTGSSFTIC